MDTLRAADGTKTFGYEWQKTQWAEFVVAAAKTEQAVATEFKTASARNYDAYLFCSDSSGVFYVSSKLAFAAKDNLGLTTEITFTFDKEGFNDVTNNPTVLKICCAVSEGLMIPAPMVTDAYGGFCG